MSPRSIRYRLFDAGALAVTVAGKATSTSCSSVPAAGGPVRGLRGPAFRPESTQPRCPDSEYQFKPRAAHHVDINSPDVSHFRSRATASARSRMFRPVAAIVHLLKVERGHIFNRERRVDGVTRAYRLGAYGQHVAERVGSGGNNSLPHNGFHGQEADHSFPGTRMGVRHVMPDGRWMQPEPLLWMGGLNALSPRSFVGGYAMGNPVTMQDTGGYCVDGMTTAACVWIVAEVTLTAADGVALVHTAIMVYGGTATAAELSVSAGFFTAGVVGFGGGAGAAAKYGDDVAAAGDNVIQWFTYADDVIPVSAIDDVAFEVGDNVVIVFADEPLVYLDEVVDGPLVFVDEVVGAATKPKPYSNPKNRPKYAEGQVEEVWEGSKQVDGKVYDPNTGEELFWDQSRSRAGQWDMGHKPGEEYRKLHSDYMDGTIDKDAFLKEYRDPNNYQCEGCSSNRSGRWEEP